MNWGVEDITTAVVLLSVTAIGLWVVAKVVRGVFRLLLLAGVVVSALAIWAHLAVGIF